MDTSAFLHSTINSGESCFPEERSSPAPDRDSDDSNPGDDETSMSMKWEQYIDVEENDLEFCDLFSRCVDRYRRLLLALQTSKL